MLTCHNLAYHGWVTRDQVGPQLDLPDSVGQPEGVNLLFEGIIAADMVNTVSPGFARESLTPQYGAGMSAALRYRGDRYVGILNGIDNELWNPATDSDIPKGFSADDLAGKTLCRQALCDELGLDPEGPLFAMVSRLDPQKGFDLVAAAAYEMLSDGARICVLGTGDPHLVDGLRQLGAAFPSRLAVVERFDRGLARRMYAGADCFLMPSRFEPCGQSQMISMRYGTIPIVRSTGGLADTVIDADADPVNGNGFSFDDPHPDYLVDAARRAMAAMADSERWAPSRRAAWPRTSRGAARRANTWRCTAGRYKRRDSSRDAPELAPPQPKFQGLEVTAKKPAQKRPKSGRNLAAAFHRVERAANKAPPSASGWPLLPPVGNRAPRSGAGVS